MPTPQELAPSGYGEDLIVLTLSTDTPSPAAFSVVDVDIDYDACEPTGIILPIELTITAPNAEHYVRHVYRSSRPSQISFIPKEGGVHLVRIREVAHNAWFGVLLVTVAGDKPDGA
jgi:hypothetical protein